MKSINYSHIGKKSTNEDSIGFNSFCFMVCDGVGGSSRGDKASSEVVKSIFNLLENKKIDESSIIQLVRDAQKHLQNLVVINPELDGMASTIAAIFINKNKAIYTCHLGDSRVYIIRPAKRLFWHTRDHSFVANLIESGEITREQGRNHPMNNRISKALVGKVDGKTLNPQIDYIDDLQKGDLIFVCSDGISETFSDVELLELLADQKSDIDNKLDRIKVKCVIGSNDNHSAILCELEDMDVPNSNKNIPLWESIDSLYEGSNLDLDKEKLEHVQSEIPKTNTNKYLIIFSVLTIIVILWLIIKYLIKLLSE